LDNRNLIEDEWCLDGTGGVLGMGGKKVLGIGIIIIGLDDGLAEEAGISCNGGNCCSKKGGGGGSALLLSLLVLGVLSVVESPFPQAILLVTELVVVVKNEEEDGPPPTSSPWTGSTIVDNAS